MTQREARTGAISSMGEDGSGGEGGKGDDGRVRWRYLRQ